VDDVEERDAMSGSAAVSSTPEVCPGALASECSDCAQSVTLEAKVDTTGRCELQLDAARFDGGRGLSASGWGVFTERADRRRARRNWERFDLWRVGRREAITATAPWRTERRRSACFQTPTDRTASTARAHSIGLRICRRARAGHPVVSRRAMSTPTIEIHRSNRLEALADALCETLQTPLSNPLAKEWILVQGRGMALWLNMALSRRLGVWANAEYIYPQRFVQRVFASTLSEGSAEAAERFSRQQLLWGVAGLLETTKSQPGFDAVRSYLGDDEHGLRAFLLAEQIARAFDEYLTYRPTLLREWERRGGEEPDQLSLLAQTPQEKAEAWQRRLWQLLTQRFGTDHVANQEHRFEKALNRKRLPASLPERVSVFGLSNLPPMYVRVLGRLGAHSQVRMFALTPTSGFFEPSAHGRHGEPQPLALRRAQTELRENALLESYANLGAQFSAVCTRELEALGVAEMENRVFERPAQQHVLGRLQADILAHEHGPDRGELELSTDDGSLAFHACHGATREVEVLHDQVLALLDAGYAPDDILVMMPNVDDYAPLIEAVFERGHDDSRRVPFRISDRRPHSENPILEAFSRILALVEKRAAASEVLDLLALEPVQLRFAVAPNDLQIITRWVTESGIRWGIDAEHKLESGVVLEHSNTWRFGLDRLLMGYAVSETERTVASVLPYAEIEGSAGLLLGRFAEFTQVLFDTIAQLRSNRTAEEWQITLTATLDALTEASTDNSWQRQQVLDALAALAATATLSQFEQPLSLPVVRRWLDRHFEDNREARGFLGGGLTFCAMVPMRSIPFRVVYLLGMNDGAFPRATQRADFNLLEFGARGLQLGDPDRRADDRYLFLEALLSARDRFIVSYVGQSIRDNATLAPSIVVSELRDYVDAQYRRSHDGVSASAALTTRHPLQPFSPRYFRHDDPRLFSYERSYLAGARMMQAERHGAKPVFEERLQPQPPRLEVPLSELVEFFDSPATYVLRRRLDVSLHGEHLEVKDREPVDVDGLDSYTIGAAALEQRLRGVPRQQVLHFAQATGLLPVGAAGQLEFERIERSVQPIAEAVRGVRREAAPQRLAVELKLTSWVLRGELDEVYPVGRVSHQFSRVRARHYVRGWIYHLVLCALAPASIEPFTWVFGRQPTGEGAKAIRFRSVNRPNLLLDELLELFAAGQNEPLHFYPESAMAFAKTLADPKHDDIKLQRAIDIAWSKTDRPFTPAVEFLYPEPTTLEFDGPQGTQAAPGLTFRELSSRIFNPLLEHVDE